jgi:hypothetical protein
MVVWSHNHIPPSMVVSPVLYVRIYMFSPGTINFYYLYCDALTSKSFFFYAIGKLLGLVWWYQCAHPILARIGSMVNTVVYVCVGTYGQTSIPFTSLTESNKEDSKYTDLLLHIPLLWQQPIRSIRYQLHSKLIILRT